MVCIGVPTLRPLYLKTRGMTLGSGYGRHQSRASSTLPQFDIVEKGLKHKRIESGSISSPVLLSTTNIATNFMAPICHSISASMDGVPPRLSESSTRPRPPAPARLSSSPRTSADHFRHPPRSPAVFGPNIGLAGEYQQGQMYHDPPMLTHLPPRSDSLRSHISRPPTASSARSGGDGVIWVRNEVAVEHERAPQWPLR